MSHEFLLFAARQLRNETTSRVDTRENRGSPRPSPPGERIGAAFVEISVLLFVGAAEAA